MRLPPPTHPPTGTLWHDLAPRADLDDRQSCRRWVMAGLSALPAHVGGSGKQRIQGRAEPWLSAAQATWTSPGCGPCGAPGRPPPAGCPAGLAPRPRAPPHPRSSDERQDTEPLVVAAFTVVTGANNDDGGLADGHVSTQCGSSTTGVSPGGTCTPGAVLLRSSAGRRLGAASRASSRTWPSTRSRVVFISVVTVAFRGA